MSVLRLRLLEIALGFFLLSAILFFASVPSWIFLLLSGGIFFLLLFFSEAVFNFHLPSRQLIPVLLLSAVLIYQWLGGSVDPYATGNQILKWLAVAGVCCLVQLLPAKGLRRLLLLLAFIGAGEAVYGFYQTWTAREHVLWEVKQSHVGFVTGSYFNRNHLAGLLELCLGCQAGFLMQEFHKRNWPAIFGGVVLMFTTLCGFLSTGSRMGILSFACAAAILFFIYLVSSQQKNAKNIIFMVACLGIGIIAASFIWLLRLQEWDIDSLRWDGGRLLAWKSSLILIGDYFWTGTGLGAFAWVFPEYQPSALSFNFGHLHQDYLELAAELGVPAFFIFIFTSAMFLKDRLVNFFKIPQCERLLIVGLFWGLVSFLLHGAGDFNFAVPANGFVFFFICAAIYRLEKIFLGRRL